MDDSGNITRTTHEDASYWDYLYDNRYRLTSATRKNPTGHIQAAYSYTYDGGDNLLTKIEPFMDDYNDAVFTGWTVGAGTWSASNNYLSDTAAAAQNDSIWKNDFTNDDHESRFSYRKVSTGSSEHIYFNVRYVDGNNYIRVDLKGDGTARILQDNAGTFTDLATNNSVAVSTNTWYDMRVVADGATVKVYRKTGANMETEILSTTSAAITSSNKVGFATTFYAKYDIDDVWLLGNSLNNTTTFTVNNASELTSMSDNNGTTTFGSDDWGRLTSKGRGSYSATYAYGYGHRMSSASTNWPNETNVSYAYYGNGKRYRKSGGTTIKYKWLGNHVINEENDAGGLVTTYIGRTLADAIGSNPASANYRYYFHDHIGSTIRLTNQSRVTLSTSQYAPFGEPMEMLGEQHSHRFAGMEWDSDVQLHYALFRYYGPGSGRWTTRDPLGQSFGLNMYEYAISNPVNYADPHGLGFLEDCNAAMDLLKQKYNEAKQLLDQAAGIGVPMLIDEDAAPPPPIKPSDIVDAIVDDAIDDATSNQGGDSSSGDEGGESTDAPDPIPQGGTSQSPPPTGGNPPYYKSHPNTNIDDALDQLDGIQAAQDKYKKGGLPDKIRSIDKSKQRVPKGGGTPRDYGAGNDDD